MCATVSTRCVAKQSRKHYLRGDTTAKAVLHSKWTATNRGVRAQRGGLPRPAPRRRAGAGDRESATPRPGGAAWVRLATPTEAARRRDIRFNELTLTWQRYRRSSTEAAAVPCLMITGSSPVRRTPRARRRVRYSPRCRRCPQPGRRTRPAVKGAQSRTPVHRSAPASGRGPDYPVEI